MKEYRRNNKTGLGLVLIIAGAILLGINFGWIPYEIRSWLFSWKMILIIIGLFMIVSKNNIEPGLILMIIGGFFLARDHHFFMWDLHKFVFPALLIIAGLIFLLRNNLNTVDDSRKYFREGEGNKNIYEKESRDL